MHLPRHLDRWLLPYLFRRRHRSARTKTAYIISICDHFEPFHHTDQRGALQRVSEWSERYPESVADFSDSTGRSPRHTFFYPIEQYDREVLKGLADICRSTGSEVEIHLHHDRETEAGLEQAVEEGKKAFREHGLLGSRVGDGELAYGFIHGNWAIANCAPGGANCGVANELDVLRRTGCYADFTMPSAPHATQFKRINSIYYADVSANGQTASAGTEVGGKSSGLGDDAGRLLMVQGPLALNWGRRKWGLFPRLENGDLTAANPPTGNRLDVWRRVCPRVGKRPDWVFVKLHTHGALPRNTEMFLGPAMRSFHKSLSQAAAEDPERTSFHYVCAREMANLIHAAESGFEGAVEECLNYRYSPPPVLD